MSETGLLAFQMEEILDTVRYVLCGLGFLAGAGAWIYATYFMGDEE